MTATHQRTAPHLLGHVHGSRRPLWATDADLLRHSLHLGHVGSGRREAALSAAANAIGNGLGLLFVDTHGDGRALRDIRHYAQAAGREDDLQLINLGPGGDGDSHAGIFNPFSDLSIREIGDMLCELVLGSVDDPPSGALDISATSRAGCFARHYLRIAAEILAELRDNGDADLSLDFILSFLRPEHFLRLVAGPKEGRLDLTTAVRLRAETMLDGHFGIDLQALAEGREQPPMTRADIQELDDLLVGAILPLLDSTGGALANGSRGLALGEAVRERQIVVLALPSLERCRADLQLCRLISRYILQELVHIQKEPPASDRPARPFLTFLADAEPFCGPALIESLTIARAAGVGFVLSALDLFSLRRYTAGGGLDHQLLGQIGDVYVGRQEAEAAEAALSLLRRAGGGDATEIRRQLVDEDSHRPPSGAPRRAPSLDLVRERMETVRDVSALTEGEVLASLGAHPGRIIKLRRFNVPRHIPFIGPCTLDDMAPRPGLTGAVQGVRRAARRVVRKLWLAA